jgi:hypothetical protein
MIRRVLRLAVVMGLMILPTAYPQNGCYSTCYYEAYNSQCAGGPPEYEQECAALVNEQCRCQCWPRTYCP